MADSQTTAEKTKEEANALQSKATAMIALADAVKKFQDNWATLEPQAKVQLRECWDFDHRKWEEEQQYKHNRNLIWLLIGGGLIWLLLLWEVIRCLEGAVSDIGKYGAVVLCVFLVISLSMPATIALFIMKRPRDD